MKFIRKYGLLVFLFLPFCANTQCTFAYFDEACANQVYVSLNPLLCGTWTAPCGAGWTRSSGTPQMISYLSPKQLTKYYAYMWVENSTSAQSGVTSGESMFYTLPAGNTFLANHSYTIKFDVITTGFVNNGAVNFYAANALQQSPITNCGNSLPNPIQKQLIGSFQGISNVWVYAVTLTFVANANYNQLWIYPSTSDANNQYSVGINYVSACENPCPATIIYNAGIIPSGTSRAGKIIAETGISETGTVTIQPTQITVLTADEVDLNSKFEAVVTTGSFTATTGGCTGFRAIAAPEREYYDIPFNPIQENINLRQANFENSLNKTQEIVSLENSKIHVYPTISTGIINIAGMFELPFTVTVFDQLGKKVSTNRNALKNNVTKLDLSNLNNGLYYIQIKTSFGKTNKKVIIRK